MKDEVPVIILVQSQGTYEKCIFPVFFVFVLLCFLTWLFYTVVYDNSFRTVVWTKKPTYLATHWGLALRIKRKDKHEHIFKVNVIILFSEWTYILVSIYCTKANSCSRHVYTFYTKCWHFQLCLPYWTNRSLSDNNIVTIETRTFDGLDNLTWLWVNSFVFD